MYNSSTARGFTLLEIMIVVAIISLVAGLAIPSFISARHKSQAGFCQNNLRVIDGALQQFALDHSNALPTAMTDLMGENPYFRDLPVCKGGGVYTLPTTLGGKPACNLHGTL